MLNILNIPLNTSLLLLIAGNVCIFLPSIFSLINRNAVSDEVVRLSNAQQRLKNEPVVNTAMKNTSRILDFQLSATVSSQLYWGVFSLLNFLLGIFLFLWGLVSLIF